MTTHAKSLLMQLLPSLVSILVLLPSVRIAPIGDDYRVIETAVPLSLGAIVSDLRTGTHAGDLYRPLEPIFLRLEHFIWGGAPSGFHVTGILLHAASAWLLYRVVSLVAGAERVALLAALLFAVHPLVAPVAGHTAARNTALVCTFLLASTWLYLEFGKTNRRRLLLLSAGCFGLALLSKEQAYLFPLFLLALSLRPEERSKNGNGWTAPFKLIAPYLAVEAIVILFGLLPSGRFLGTMEYAESSPLSFSPGRLAEDVTVLLATAGVLDFGLRDALISMSYEHSWLTAAIWLACAIIVLIPVALARRKSVALAALGWFAISLGPLRLRPVEFFEMNNLYLAVPVVASVMAVLITKFNATKYVALAIGAACILFWTSTLLRAQAKLTMMGRFATELHLLFEDEPPTSKNPLRVIVNVPDPFRSTEGRPELARWMVFRVLQSALELGGYSPQNMFLVENERAQILTAEHGDPCQYDVMVQGPENVRLIRSADSPCRTDLSFIDFSAKQADHDTGWYTQRKAKYRGVPLTDAELYVFDGSRLRRLQ